MVRVQNRISQGLKLLQYFTMRPWNFPCPAFDSIQTILDEEEKVIFNTDLRQFDRNSYLYQCIEGGRVFCFKEKTTDIPINRKYHNVLYVLDWIVKILFWFAIISVIVSWFEPVKKILRYGGPVVQHMPFIGSAVFDNN